MLLKIDEFISEPDWSSETIHRTHTPQPGSDISFKLVPREVEFPPDCLAAATYSPNGMELIRHDGDWSKYISAFRAIMGTERKLRAAQVPLKEFIVEADQRLVLSKEKADSESGILFMFDTKRTQTRVLTSVRFLAKELRELGFTT